MSFSGAIVLPPLAILLQPNHWFVCFYKATLQSSGRQNHPGQKELVIDVQQDNLFYTD